MMHVSVPRTYLEAIVESRQFHNRTYIILTIPDFVTVALTAEEAERIAEALLGNRLEELKAQTSCPGGARELLIRRFGEEPELDLVLDDHLCTLTPRMAVELALALRIEIDDPQWEESSPY